MHTCSPSKSSFHHRLSNERDLKPVKALSRAEIRGISKREENPVAVHPLSCNASHVKQLLTWLQQGNIVVLVRDTGTPVISDPDMEPLCLAS
ncbi:hypothetical protein AAC387_Pa06g1205 [Persea americana]